MTYADRNNGDPTATRNRAAVLPTASKLRSKLTNGSVVVLGDNRGPWARRKRDLYAQYLLDLGGVEVTSEMQRAIAGSASTLKTELEILDSRFSEAGGATAHDLDLYSRVSGNLRRLLESLSPGLQRCAKPASLVELMDGTR